jgi:hypothetical protein
MATTVSIPQHGAATPQIIKHLIDAHAAELGLPAWTDPDFVSVFARKARISPGTSRSIRDGLSKGLQSKIRDRLAELFRDAIPHIEPHWFQLSLPDFIARAQEQPRNKKRVSFDIPAAGYKNFERLQRWLCGVYVCYRYSFEQSDERLVAREVLSVGDRAGTLLFQMSFVPGGGEAGQEVNTFDGVVLPLGESLLFVGWNEDRGRSLFFHCDYAAESRNCRIGILTSTRLSNNQAPLAACVVLIKRETPPRNFEEFIKGATMSLPFEAMIDADFGKGARTWLGEFLSNEPHTIDLEGRMIPDFVLRLNLHRFTAGMPPLYRAALGNKHIRSPFKPEWDRPQGGRKAR